MGFLYFVLPKRQTPRCDKLSRRYAKPRDFASNLTRVPQCASGYSGVVLTPDHAQARVDYRDLGPDHFERTDKMRLAARLTRKLGELGFDVTLTQRSAATVLS
jgi:hypothetical protein